MENKNLLFISVGPPDLTYTGKEYNAFLEIFKQPEVKLAEVATKAYVPFTRLKEILEENSQDHNVKPYELLHFTGHSNEDYIEFEDGKVSKEDFVDLIRGFPMLKVIVLNSCYSEKIGAALLELEHIEVVIGSTHIVYENDGILFTQAFYGNLTDGKEVELAFNEAKASLVGEDGKVVTEEDRGKIKDLDGVDEGEALVNFPFEIRPKPSRQPWILIDTPSDDEGCLNLLCFYGKSEKNDLCYQIIKNVISNASIKNPIYEKIDVFNLEDYKRFPQKKEELKKVHAILFFLYSGFKEEWSSHKDDFTRVLGNVRLGVLHINGPFKKREDLEGIPFSKAIYILDESTLDPHPVAFLETLLNFKPDNLLQLLVKLGNVSQEQISEKLIDAFPDLNYKKQKKVFEAKEKYKLSKFNLIFLEGTECCGHELCLKMIFSKTNVLYKEAKIEYSRLADYYVEKIEEIEDEENSKKEILTVDSFWKEVDREVLQMDLFKGSNDKSTLIHIIKATLKTKPIIFLFRDIDSAGKYALFQEFWKEVTDELDKIDIPENYYSFFLVGMNKNCQNFSRVSEESIPPKNNVKYGIITLGPIEKLNGTSFRNWFGSNQMKSAIGADSRYSAIMGEHKKLIEDDPYMQNVVTNVSTKMGSKHIIDEVITLKQRQ